MNIVLINSTKDYEHSVGTIGEENSTSYSFFTVNNLPPYLVDTNLDINNLCKWKDHGVKDLNTSRFWMDNYKELNVIVSRYVKESSLNNNFFKFGLVMSLPWEILLPLYEFGEFIKRYNVESVMINKEHDNLKNVFSEFIENSSIRLEYYQ